MQENLDNTHESKIVSLWTTCGYIALSVSLTLLVVFSHGLSTVHFYTELYADPLKIREIFGPSDAGSYLSAAIQLDTISSLSPETNWIINLWPPGMLVLEALILRFLENDFYFGVVLGVITAFAWGVFLGYLASVVHKMYGKILAILLLVLIVSVGPIHDWILNYGLFYADGFGALFLLVGITFLIFTFSDSNLLTRKLSFGIFAGICFAVSAYFRASYINILYALLASSLACLIVFFVLKIGRRRIRNLAQVKHSIKAAAVFLTATVAMFICVNPWMSYVEGEVRGTREWSVVGDSFINGMWVERSEMPGFLSEGGIGWACKIDPDKCAVLTELKLAQPTLGITHKQLSEAILVALNNPGEYALDRGKFIGIAWSSSELGQMADVFNHPLSVFNLVGLLGFFVILGKHFARGWPLIISITGIYSTLLIPLLIGHIEIRYLLPFKLLPLLIPVLLLQREIGRALAPK